LHRAARISQLSRASLCKFGFALLTGEIVVPRVIRISRAHLFAILVFPASPAKL
jgi:hypothetical protein